MDTTDEAAFQPYVPQTGHSSRGLDQKTPFSLTTS